MPARIGLLQRSVLALLVVSAACSDTTASDLPGTLSLSVTAAPPVMSGTAAATSIEPTAAGLEQRDDAHTLVFSSVQLVVRRIELARVDAACSEDDDDDDDDRKRGGHCEELKLGPLLVDVPLDGDVERVFSVQLPEGTYRAVELQIHKPSLGNESDLAFLRENPLLEGVSILVEGTYDGDPFTFVQRVEAKERYALDPPLEVTEASEPTNLTFHLDVSTWFVDPEGALVDPVSANRGGEHEGLVRSNILKSLNAFKDDDRDGECDDDDRRGG